MGYSFYSQQWDELRRHFNIRFKFFYCFRLVKSGSFSCLLDRAGDKQQKGIFFGNDFSGCEALLIFMDCFMQLKTNLNGQYSQG